MGRTACALEALAVLDEAARLAIVRASDAFDAEWYRRSYPDAPRSGLDAALHCVRYGVAMGRSPGPRLDAGAYRKAHPGIVEAGVDPLLHYERIGRAAGHEPAPAGQPGGGGAARRELRRFGRVRGRLLGLGFTERPLADLRAMADGSPEPAVRAQAARELALWSLRQRTEEGARAALADLALARRTAPDLDFRRRLAVVELLCHHRLGQSAEARACFERAALQGEVASDALLAFANHVETPEARCGLINEVLRRHGAPPVALRPDPRACAYDRLTGGTRLPAAPSGGPRVSVLIAAYEAERTLPTALRSLVEQSWRDLEILVVDDASPDGTADLVRRVAARDPRVRLVEMARNGGAYVARNRGLALATGDYVTLHDADDWSHPRKIETQARYLAAHPEAVACLSEQARATPDLGFTRLTGQGLFIIRNVSSLMVRRAPLQAALGGWDSVRFAADSELIRRLEIAFGREAVVDLPTGPLSLQRHAEGSITADEVMGIAGFHYGARKEYLDAQRFHHASGAPLRYEPDPGRRPFPVPPMMRPDRAERLGRPRRVSVVIAGDFRVLDDRLEAVIAEVRALRAEGRRVGLVELYDYDLDAPAKPIHDALRAEVDGEGVQVLVFGEEVRCDALRLVGDRPDPLDQRYLPRILSREGEPLLG